LIFPVRLRRVASGLMIEKVRSLAIILELLLAKLARGYIQSAAQPQSWAATLAATAPQPLKY
jgi:hypothetical protein